MLQHHKIAYLIDVRSTPYSRYKPEFSKEALAAELERHGVRYVFMGDTLGGHPDDEDCYDEQGQVDYEKVKIPKSTRTGLHAFKLPLLNSNALRSCVVRESRSSATGVN